MLSGLFLITFGNKSGILSDKNPQSICISCDLLDTHNFSNSSSGVLQCQFLQRKSAEGRKIKQFFELYSKTNRLRWSRGSVLAFGTQVRGLKPSQSRQIFKGEKSSARLPSEGK